MVGAQELIFLAMELSLLRLFTTKLYFYEAAEPLGECSVLQVLDISKKSESDSN